MGPDRREEERGAFLILWALLIVALMVMVAIVIDLGQLRDDRRTVAATSDLAALAAGPQLGALGGSDPVGACNSAWDYILRNTPDMPAGAAMPCGNLTTASPSRVPCTNGTTPPLDISATNTGRYQVTFRYPVSDADIADSLREASAGPFDGLPCERFRVTMSRTTDTYFAGVMGVTDQTATASAVVRGFLNPNITKVAALLILERTECQALQTSGQGNVLIRKANDDNPGITHIDSDGSQACTGSGASNSIVWGTAIPNGGGSTRPGDPSILMEGVGAVCPGPTATPRGLLSMVGSFAPTVGGVFPPSTGVCPPPSEGTISSRKVADDRYNPTSNPRINQLRTQAETLTLNTSLADLRAVHGYKVFPDDYVGETCDGPLTPILDPKVVINCGVLYSPNANLASFVFESTHVIVKGGGMRARSGRSIFMPNAEQIFIEGSPTVGLDVVSTFRANDANSGSCLGGEQPGATPNKIVILSGPLTSGANGVTVMCQTFVYLADGGASPSQVTSGGTCTTEKPCAARNNFTGYVRLGGASITWTAPNQSAAPPDDQNPYEDLALWTETGSAARAQNDNINQPPNSSIGEGGSATDASGVFFLPNAAFRFAGNSNLSQPFNAQFIARKVILSGQGDLVMQPSPSDAVPNPFPSWALIR